MTTKPYQIAIPFDFHEKYGYFLKTDLVRRLKLLNIHAVPLFYHEDEVKKLDAVEGLLIPGGINDVDPAHYCEGPVHSAVKICKERTEFEFNLLENFIPTGKPILCICWGMQMMNVYFDGKLFQHLPDEYKSRIRHEQEAPVHEPTHHFRFVQNSPGIELFKNESLFVNSTHHQGVSEVGNELSVEGHAEDDLIEAISHRTHPFFWGVQWHPERLENDPIIPAFLKACRPQR